MDTVSRLHVEAILPEDFPKVEKSVSVKNPKVVILSDRAFSASRGKGFFYSLFPITFNLLNSKNGKVSLYIGVRFRRASR
jgi:hypothetical protein